MVGPPSGFPSRKLFVVDRESPVKRKKDRAQEDVSQGEFTCDLNISVLTEHPKIPILEDLITRSTRMDGSDK
jgi:hypothetical protein